MTPIILNYLTNINVQNCVYLSIVYYLIICEFIINNVQANNNEILNEFEIDLQEQSIVFGVASRVKNVDNFTNCDFDLLDFTVAVRKKELWALKSKYFILNII